MPRYAEPAHLAAYPKYGHGGQVPGSHRPEHHSRKQLLPATPRHPSRHSHVDMAASHVLPPSMSPEIGEETVMEARPADPFAAPRMPMSQWRWNLNLTSGMECAIRTNVSVKNFPGISHRLGVVVSVCKEDLAPLADLSCRVGVAVLCPPSISTACQSVPCAPLGKRKLPPNLLLAAIVRCGGIYAG